MIIINVLYCLMVCLVSYKHTQVFLGKKYERARKSASGAIEYLKEAGTDARAKVSVLEHE
jgi:hypothetical protein